MTTKVRWNEALAPMVRNAITPLLFLDLILIALHILLPDYTWGQGRSSWFSFEGRVTLPSWFITMQLFCAALLALLQRERESAHTSGWALVALLLLLLSVEEMTRATVRLSLFGGVKPDVYHLLTKMGGGLTLLVTVGWFVLRRFGACRLAGRMGRIAFALWFLYALLPVTAGFSLALAAGTLKLFGATTLLAALAFSLIEHPCEEKPVLFEPGGRHQLLYAGVAGATFIIITLQIIFFQLITIFGSYNTANSVISVALLGLSLGGLLAYRATEEGRFDLLLASSLGLPFSLLMAFGTVVTALSFPFASSLLLMAPFTLAGVIITVALVSSASHRIYFVDLVGAGLGALLVNTLLVSLREEGSLFLLAALSFVVALVFISFHPQTKIRRFLSLFAVVGALLCGGVALTNPLTDVFNVIRSKVVKKYKKAVILHSRSSLVGRYDVIRRRPGDDILKTRENGRVIDTVRPNPTEDYLIDPRLPYNLHDKPNVLILGVSGDGVTKTAKLFGGAVVGVEINRQIVDLMRNELYEANGHSYDDIEVSAIDGRSFLTQDERQYDVITLLNAHFAKGSVWGRSASPEYLHTYDAFVSYLDHLTDRGYVNIESPVNRPAGAVPVWKQLVTMRQALLDRGVTDTAPHFFVFRWKTRTGNYIQVMMKKTPFTQDEVARLKVWLHQIDTIRKQEKREGRRLGPIRTATTTLLADPFAPNDTNYSRAARGELDPATVAARRLTVSDDDRPFPFDVDAGHDAITAYYKRTLLLILLLTPFFVPRRAMRQGGLALLAPYLLTVGLTGAAYFLVEMVLIQRFEMFIGSPVVTLTMTLGTLLISSGFGSLYSGVIDARKVSLALGGVVGLLLFHRVADAAIFATAATLPLTLKVIISVALIAPLGFLMAIPFPFVMRLTQERLEKGAPAILFAINGAASALAIPLALHCSTTYGLSGTFLAATGLYGVVAFLIFSLTAARMAFPIVVGASLLSLALFVSPLIPFAAAAYAGPEKFDLYALQYGKSRYDYGKVVAREPHDETVRFGWYFWLARTGKRVILVDTGFDDRAKAKKLRFGEYTRPVTLLKRLGVAPSDVTDLVITHAHFDHIGDLARYSHATIWMGRAEYEEIKRRRARNKRGYAADRLRTIEPLLTQAENEGRLKLVDETATVAPGCDLVVVGGHTPGSLMVRVETLDGYSLLASDSAPLYRNIGRHQPIGTGDRKANRRAIERMQTMAADPLFILPGHDRRVMRRFEEVAENIVHISGFDYRRRGR